ncbi:MAG: restriction endonuclease subunit S, partial [Pirellula staleyi]
RGQVGQVMFDSTSNQACAGIRFFGDGLEIRDYVRLVFRKKYHELRALAAGGAQPNLNGGMIRLMRVPLPPLSEQKRIVSKVTELLSLCDALEAKLTQAESASTQLLSAAVHHLLNNRPTTESAL